METLSSNQETYDEVIKETKEGLEKLKNNIEKKETDTRIETIKEKIAGLKSFKDLPISLNYEPIGHDSKEILPTKIDIQPRPIGNKRYLNGKETKGPDPLIIMIDKRTFSITPDLGSIEKMNINNGNVILETTFKNETYTPERMTRLLLLLRRYKGPINEDIKGTAFVTAKEI